MLQISSDISNKYTLSKLKISGTFLIGRCWGGERARTLVELCKLAIYEILNPPISFRLHSLNPKTQEGPIFCYNPAEYSVRKSGFFIINITAGKEPGH
jgi:hypothetical protein